jgi:hypothetical protein
MKIEVCCRLRRAKDGRKLSLDPARLIESVGASIQLVAVFPPLVRRQDGSDFQLEPFW